MHEHWEVTSLLHLKISRPLHLLLSWSWITNFHDVDFLGVFSRFLLAEAEQGVLVLGGISHWHVSECGGKTLQDLLLPLLDEEKLHMGADLLVLTLIDSNKIAPFASAVDAVVHDLTGSEFGFLLEDLLGGSRVVDISVVDIGLSNNTKLILTNPAPEPDLFSDFALLHLGLGVQIEYLDDGFGALSGSQGNNVL